MVKQRHTPIRTCVACRETDEKRDLLRVVRQPEGTLRYDPKGKLSGRGAYVCARASCIALARKQKKLERSLKVSSVPEEVFVELNAQAALNSSSEEIAISPSPELAPLPGAGQQPTTTSEPLPVAASRSGSGDQNRGENTDVAIDHRITAARAAGKRG